MKPIAFSEVEAYTPRWLGVVAALGAVILVGLASAWYMEHNGHWVTGMTNQIVWGMPHVFAVFLIVAASGALNVASIASVFGRTAYKPLAPLSALLAIALLAGGLAVLVLDLGRPDQLDMAMIHYNFKSIFAWNIILYTGFFAVVGVYIWMMLDRRMTKRYGKPAGFAAFVWRLVLTTGTGSIFGFLVARELYNSAVMAPLFIAMSFSFGLAFYILVMMAGCGMTDRPLGDKILVRLKNLLGVFIAAVAYFVVAQHLTNLYMAERADASLWILFGGNVYSLLFWVVQIGLGTLAPLALIFHPALRIDRKAIAAACLLTLIGGVAQVYIIIIGGQAWPLNIFAGYEVVSSTFFDGQVAAYVPSLPEILLGASGFAIALAIVLVGASVLRFLPATLADEAIPADEH